MWWRAVSAAILGSLALAVPASAADALVVVQANVGNVNVPGCERQVFKLCQRPVEARAARALRALKPDIAGFQEILPADLCRRAPSTSPDNLCSGALSPPSQPARLLGPGYPDRCDSRFGWDCVAVRAGRVGLDPAWITRPVQPGCEDEGFTLAAGTLRLRGWPVTVAVAHPDSTDAACRAVQVRDLFRSLPASGPALLLGDWNLDPFRGSDASVAEWRRWVPSRFRQASGAGLTSLPCGTSQLDPTGRSLDGALAPCAGPLAAKTLDHVLTRGLNGGCEVQRVDGGGGMDHRAQVCRLSAPPEVAPRFTLRPRSCRIGAVLVPRPAYLRAVRFRTARRVVVDRRPPFRMVRRGAERGRMRVAARPLLVNGRGPVARRRAVPCRR